MFDNLTARGRALLVLGAAGSVIGAGLTASAVSISAATFADLSLNPAATSANLLDMPGYNSYDLNAYPATTDLSDPWVLQLSDVQGSLPTVDSYKGDGTTGKTGVDSDITPTITSATSAVYGLGTAATFMVDGVELPGVTFTGDTAAFSSATATFFKDTNHDGAIDSGDHVSPSVVLQWLDPSQLTLNLTAPGSIVGGDPITSALTISPQLAPNVLKSLDLNNAVVFSYFNQLNKPFPFYGNTDTGFLAGDGMTFTGSSADTAPDAHGVYKTKATVLRNMLPEALTPTTTASTVVNDFNVGSLSLTTPDSANVRNIPASAFENIFAAAHTSNVTRCGTTCNDVLIRSGTKSVTYSAAALSEDDTPVPVPNVPVTFTLYGDPLPATLAVNGVPVQTRFGLLPPLTSTTVTVPAGVDGIAHLTVTDNNANDGDQYVVSASTNGQFTCWVLALYQNAKASNVETTPSVQAAQSGGETTISSVVLDQWNRPFFAPGLTVAYIDFKTLYASANHPNISSPLNTLNLPEAGNTILAGVPVGLDGHTIGATPLNDVGAAFRDTIDGRDCIFVAVYQGQFLINDLFGQNLLLIGQPAQVQWLAQPDPSFVTERARHFPVSGLSVGTSLFTANESIMTESWNSAPVIPVDTSMGTNRGRHLAGLVKLKVKVTNGELPAQALGGIPVTFSGPAGASFAVRPMQSCLGGFNGFSFPFGGVCWDAPDWIPPFSSFAPTQTVLTDANGEAEVWATATMIGSNAFRASVGDLSASKTLSFINLPWDARNIMMSPHSSHLTSGLPQTMTASVTDVFTNPVANVPLLFGETGVGRFWDGTTSNGGHADSGNTDATGTALVTVTTAAGEFGTATAAGMVPDTIQCPWLTVLGYLPFCDLDSIYEGDGNSQVFDPAGFIYDAPVAGVAAGNNVDTATVDYGVPPTFTAPAVLGGPGLAPISGRATPGAIVTLLMNGVAGPSGLVGDDGSFSFNPAITKSTLFAVTATGMTAPSQLTTVLVSPSTSPAGGGIKAVNETPSKPTVSSPRRGQLRTAVASKPRLVHTRVDFYLAGARGKVGRFIGSSSTNSNGVAVLLFKGAKHGATLHVRAFVHGVSGRVFGAWSPVSNAVHIK